MSAPATSGQLRSKISDMVIGDYIVCNYQASSGVAGTFSNLGGTVGTEIPLLAPATPNGTFYLIKADKGLLISDRVVQSGISWDALNAAKRIQGIPWGGSTIVPIMTSNTTPSGTAFTSSVAAAAYDAYVAFNGDPADHWNSVNSGLVFPVTLGYDFAANKIIKGYALSTSTFGNLMPKSWTFEGWDGTQWKVLDQKVGITGWANGERRFFPITNNTAYTKYQINITEAQTSQTQIIVGEFEMTDVAGIIRSLSGGIAWADANGNSATADASKGGWPTINEWDTYIVHSTLGGKIVAGNDATWHWSGVYSWTQDTSSKDVYANSAARVYRGNTSLSKMVFGGVTSDFGSVLGFRPVFQY